jgi:hypothetical protein
MSAKTPATSSGSRRNVRWNRSGSGSCSGSRWASSSCTSRTDPHRGCALVAAPRTYLRQTLEDALQRFAPEVPGKPVQGRDVPVALHRAITQLGFRATIALEDLDPDLLADLDGSTHERA